MVCRAVRRAWMGSGLLERDLLLNLWLVPVNTAKPKGRAGCTSRGSHGSGNEITATRGAKESQSKPCPECFSEDVWSMQEGRGNVSLCMSVQPNLLCLF